MGRVRPHKDWQSVCDVLWGAWDPIGVNDVPEARGEYDSYAAEILRLLYATASEADLFAHLRRIEIELMGLHNVSTTEMAAQALLALDLDGS